MRTSKSSMLPLARIAVLSSLTISLGFAPADPADPFQRFELPGGIRLVVLQIEDAPRQSTFTFLPIGLAQDAADRAQYSHLVEHMLIRSTDPDSLSVPGIIFNGETMAGSLRVESYAEPDRWQAALDRHLSWMQLDSIDDEVLEREKLRIAGEEESTVGAGYTHKWAQAAWNQVIRHGRSSARVHSDVVDASAADVLDYAKMCLANRGAILIACVGPIEPEAIRARLAAGLEVTKDGERTAPVVEASSAVALDRVSKQAKWDLNAHHYMEWIPLPDRNATDRIAAHAFVQIINMALANDSVLGGGAALASVISVPEGRYLMLSSRLADSNEVKTIHSSFESLLQRAASGSAFPIAMATMQLKLQASKQIDPAPMRKQLERMGRDTTMLEAQLLLTAINNEIQLGLTYSEIQEVWSELDSKRLEQLFGGIVSSKGASTLLLRPN